MCYCTKIPKCGGEEAAGLDLGQAGGLSATCLHGKGLGGSSVSEEGSTGGGTLGFVLGSHGFRDGGGLTQAFTGFPVVDTPPHLQRTILAPVTDIPTCLQRTQRTIPVTGKNMWWPRGWRCWWWYMNPYMMYPPYWQAPQQPSQTAQQPTQQPPIAPLWQVLKFTPPAQTVVPTHENCVHFKDGFCALHGVQVDSNTPACPSFTPKSSATTLRTPSTNPVLQAPAGFPSVQNPFPPFLPPPPTLSPPPVVDPVGFQVGPPPDVRVPDVHVVFLS